VHAAAPTDSARAGARPALKEPAPTTETNHRGIPFIIIYLQRLSCILQVECVTIL